VDTGTAAALAIVLSVAVVLVFLIPWLARESRRRERFKVLPQAASSQGLSFSPQDPRGMLQLPLAIIPRGDPRRGSENLVSRTWQGMPVMLFDVWYDVTSQGEYTTTNTYRSSFAVVETLPQSTPALVIDEEPMLSRLGRHLGMHDIEVRNPEFDRRFRVRADDPALATALLDPATVQGLKTLPNDWQIELRDRYLAVKRPLWAPEELAMFLGWMKWLLDRATRALQPERSSRRPQ
jgi:hypothetical protein